MQATDFGNLHDPARLGELDGPDVRRILVEREMRASPVIVGEVSGQDPAQVPFAKDDDMIETLAPDRADEPLREGVLPRAVRCREDFLDPHALHTLPDDVAVDPRRDREGDRKGLNHQGRRPRSAGPSRRRWDGR